MANKVKRFFKRIVFTKLYCNCYPIADESFCNALNECTPDNNELWRYKVLLEKFINSDLADNNMELKSAEKNRKICFKTKKIKKKDENGNKQKEKVQVAKKRFKQEEEQYSEQIKNINTQTDNLSELYDSLIDNNLTVDDIPLLEKVIYRHRINNGLEIGIALAIILLIIFIFVKRTFF